MNSRPAKSTKPTSFIAILSQVGRLIFARNAADHIARGRRGEEMAARVLRAKGFRILRRNFRPPRGGEIDIVARDQEVLVFVEVKARGGDDFGRPSVAVDRKKRRRIIMGAMSWLRLLDLPDIAFRFDIVEVIDDSEVTHIENAFNLPEPLHY
ncbi:MAG: hypothetical protein Fur0032_12520 [Terrimicrobiaceae bacterium]